MPHAAPPLAPAANARARRLALVGVVVNFALALVKLAAGVFGNSYALIADAIESLADILGSALIWGGLRVAARPASPRHPYGYGRAESLAALAVAVLILAAGLFIAVEAVYEIVTPHSAPAPFTLAVLVGVIAIKEGLFRVARRTARESGSVAAATDAWHHRADAITSLAAFVGISIALIGGPGWEPADDWAALAAAGVVVFNAFRLMTPPLRELLDAQPAPVVDRAAAIAAGVPRVDAVQKTHARKSGTRYWVDMHVWVDPAMTVRDAHTLAHAIKDAVRADNPHVADMMIHIEPADRPPDRAEGRPEP